MQQFKYILALSLAVLFLTSCNKKEEVIQEKDEILQMASKTIETYAEEGTEIETVEYVYANTDDVFWQKAVYKNAKGEIDKTVDREFDANRLPILEKTIEMEAVSSSIKMKYDPTNLLLLEQAEYNGEATPENISAKYKLNYDGQYLVSKECWYYSNEADFKNVDGQKVSVYINYKIMPGKEARPTGQHSPALLVQEAKYYFTKRHFDYQEANKVEGEKEYKIGDLYATAKTDFDQEGMPKHMITGEEDCSHHATEEWYKIEKDGLGNIISIDGYSDKELTKQTPKNMQYSYAYGEDGLISKVDEKRYNPETKAYDKFHDGQTYTWVDSKITGKYKMFYNDASTISEHYCYGGEQYSFSETKIVKYDKTQLVEETHAGGYSGKFNGRKSENKLTKKTTTTYKTN